MKRYYPLLFLLAMPTGLHAQTPPRSMITHVTVVDVQTGAEAKDQTVVLEAGRITSISASSPDGAVGETIDAHGGYLIPGLWDMHGHIQDTDELPLYVANGVTGVRMMAGSKDTKALRAELSKQEISPQIYLASAIVDGPDPRWPGSIVIKKAEDAHKAVDDIKASGADFIKVYDGIPRAAYFALADEAKKEGIAFEGHVPEQITAQEASAAGQRSMEHLNGIGVGCSKQEQSLMAELERASFFRQKMVVEAEAYRSFDAAKCQLLFKEFRQNDTWQVPTLTVNSMWSRLDDSKLYHDPRLAYINKAARKRWDDRTTPLTQRWSGADYSVSRGVVSVDKQIVGLMFRAGVPLMAGTDAMNPYCFPGFSLHDELALLVESGLTPLAALQTATINPAKFMGRVADEGTVSSGKIANLVLLDADPLADIHNTTHTQAVWVAGRYYDRQALNQLLEKAKQLASK